jgi:predicted nucleotidyltransferase
MARGKANKLSDIDLCIVGEIREEQLIKELDRLEIQLQREINYNLYSRSLFQRETKSSDAFLKKILMDKKIMLIGTENELRSISQK